MMEPWVARLAFPIVAVGAIGAAIALMHNGVNLFVAMFACQLPAFLCVIALERLQPLHRRWNRSHDDIGVDAALTLTVTITTGLMMPLIT